MRFLLTTAAALALAAVTFAAEPPRVKGYVSIEEHEALKARVAELEKVRAAAGPVCPCGAAGCVAGDRSAVKAPGGYPYPDHVVRWNGVRIDDTAAGVSVSRFSDGGQSHAIDPRKSAVYLNGERYDPSGAYRFRDSKQDELSSWYAYTGPCRLTVRGGAYYFDSLAGAELERWLQHGDEVLATMAPEQRRHHERADLVYGWYNPRLKTMSDCRAAWAEWERTHPGGWDGKPPASTIRVGAPAARQPATDPPGTFRTDAGTLVRPKIDGPGFEEVPGLAPLRAAPSYAPAYLPTYSLPSGPVQSCPGGRCPIR